MSKTPTRKRPRDKPCWIVWTKTTSGETVLRAICSTQWLANDYRKWSKYEREVIATTVERSLINHLYAGTFQKRYTL